MTQQNGFHQRNGNGKGKHPVPITEKDERRAWLRLLDAEVPMTAGRQTLLFDFVAQRHGQSRKVRIRRVRTIRARPLY